MFGVSYPDWFTILVFAGLCIGLFYVIIHCIIEDVKRDFKKGMKKRPRATEKRTRQVMKIVKEKRVYTIKPEIEDIDV